MKLILQEIHQLKIAAQKPPKIKKLYYLDKNKDQSHNKRKKNKKINQKH